MSIDESDETIQRDGPCVAPNWRDVASYAHTRTLSRSDLGQEFVRRQPAQSSNAQTYSMKELLLEIYHLAKRSCEICFRLAAEWLEQYVYRRVARGNS